MPVGLGAIISRRKHGGGTAQARVISKKRTHVVARWEVIFHSNGMEFNPLHLLLYGELEHSINDMVMVMVRLVVVVVVPNRTSQNDCKGLGRVP